MVRRTVFFVLGLAAGYRVAYVIVETIGGAAIRFPWRESPRMLASQATAALRERVTDPVRDRMADARAAVGEGRAAMRRREQELRAENGLRQSS